MACPCKLRQAIIQIPACEIISFTFRHGKVKAPVLNNGNLFYLNRSFSCMESHFTGFGISVIIRIYFCFLFPECISCHILNRFHLTAGDSKKDSAVFFCVPAKEAVTFPFRLGQADDTAFFCLDRIYFFSSVSVKSNGNFHCLFLLKMCL